jgi:colicin import membrane protein
MAPRGSGYRTAVLASVLLHGALLYLLISGGYPEFRPRELARPTYIEASLLQMKPPATRAAISAPEKPKQEPAKPTPPKPEPPKPKPPKPEIPQPKSEPPKTKPAADDAAAKRAEQLVQQKAAQQKAVAEKAAKEKAAKEKAAKEKAAQEKAANERAANEKAAREKAVQDERRQQEQQAAAEQAAAAARADMVSTYSDYIRDRIEGNWSRPPSARRDMQVEIRIRMVPTGQVMSVVVTRSSGDPAFDQSAVTAVERVGRFDRLQELARKDPLLFERNFRDISLTFKPEDLRL